MAALDDTAPDGDALPGLAAGEADLWRTYRATGSASARQALFDLYFDFARRIARKHFLDRKSGDIEFADLSQLACTGLLEAIERYDVDRGTPFQPYARRRIAGSILDGLAHMSERREQVSFRERTRKERLRSLSVESPEKLDAAGAMAALIEMATGLALGFMIDGAGMYVSKDEADHLTSPYDSLAWKETTRSLTAEIAHLPDPDGRIIRYHYLDGMSFEQIARAYGLSKSRISQIHRSALKSLKDRLSPAMAFNFRK
ncbi:MULTISPECIES: sigma-70 family RNA polymerase sigma factor [Asticcacaulis]|uniref:sigma-70 family RNA polymerase sigma factor n=1 Tax=Asticcacaulis TaxID=76890 RepID=UPI001AE24ECB|nr:MULTISPECIES: sigma-70 family RNA polymerase sigma factor [Asticcacaulis]MBP2161165.1 RNA polymerase sigma factor for flagellar operon FliA [Asticcacaulis solisilvae]MDR6802210.1 RNA polymerase sigma factor for flagellar operon FliA [Asticcacaulis sp. BE141]